MSARRPSLGGFFAECEDVGLEVPGQLVQDGGRAVRHRSARRNRLGGSLLGVFRSRRRRGHRNLRVGENLRFGARFRERPPGLRRGCWDKPADRFGDRRFFGGCGTGPPEIAEDAAKVADPLPDGDPMTCRAGYPAAEVTETARRVREPRSDLPGAAARVPPITANVREAPSDLRRGRAGPCHVAGHFGPPGSELRRALRSGRCVGDDPLPGFLQTPGDPADPEPDAAEPGTGFPQPPANRLQARRRLVEDDFIRRLGDVFFGTEVEDRHAPWTLPEETPCARSRFRLARA